MLKAGKKFLADWRDERGDRHRVSFDSQAEAIAFEEHQKAVALGLRAWEDFATAHQTHHGFPVSESNTLGPIWNQWGQCLRALRDSPSLYLSEQAHTKKLGLCGCGCGQVLSVRERLRHGKLKRVVHNMDRSKINTK